MTSREWAGFFANLILSVHCSVGSLSWVKVASPTVLIEWQELGHNFAEYQLHALLQNGRSSEKLLDRFAIPD